MTVPSELLLASEDCGENLKNIANLAAVLAPELCDGCTGYHMRVPARRYVVHTDSIDSDRTFVTAKLAGVFGEVLANRTGTIVIAIIGSADTGLLATCAHTVAKYFPHALARTRFIVVDKCRTPLVLCEAFAKLHALNLETLRADVNAGHLPFFADVMVLHSLLRFVPDQDRPVLLARLGHHLLPHGRLIVSNLLRPETAPVDQLSCQLRETTQDKILAAFSSGQIRTSLPFVQVQRLVVEANTMGGQRKAGFASVGEAQHVFAEAGLHVHDLEELVLDIAPGVMKHRLIAVLGPGK